MVLEVGGGGLRSVYSGWEGRGGGVNTDRQNQHCYKLTLSPLCPGIESKSFKEINQYHNSNSDLSGILVWDGQ